MSSLFDEVIATKNSRRLGRAMAGGRPAGREDHDFYPTPADCTRALIAAEESWICEKPVWEPACGDGAIARVLEEEALCRVVATDLIDRGYGEGGVDFLAARELLAPFIVTNPPFSVAAQFISHALETLKAPYLALLLKATYWHAAGRLPLYERRPPSAIYPLTWRPDFLNKGAPTMDVAWVVWRPVAWPHTVYKPLARPKGGA